METGTVQAEKISSRKRSSSSGWARKPAPLPFAVTVPDGQPRFRLTSPQPRLPSRFAAQMKSAAVRVSSCGTAGTPSLYSGSTSRFWRGVSPGCVVGVMNGMKYLSMPGKNS